MVGSRLGWVFSWAFFFSFVLFIKAVFGWWMVEVLVVLCC